MRGRPPEIERLGAAEGGGDGLQACDDVVELDAEAERERGGAERVVDVVEAGEGELDPAALQREGGGLDAVELDVGARRPCGCGRSWPQFGHL